MLSEFEYNELSERYDLLRQAFNEPTFTVKVSTGGNEGGTYKFKNGVLESWTVSGDLKRDVNKNAGELDVFLESQLNRKNTLKQIFDIVKSRYETYRSMTPRNNRVRRADSFYKAFSNAVAPVYSANVNDRERILPLLDEYATSQADKEAIAEEKARLQAEFGPEIEIRAERKKKIITEVFLYGVPAIIGLVLIIRKFKK